MCSFFPVESPTLPELVRLRVHREVGANHSKFGVLLLQDRTGSQVYGLHKACQGDPQDVVLRILHEWLEGKGLPVTWESLVHTLRDIDLNTLADHIEASKLSPH